MEPISLPAEFAHRRLTWWPEIGVGYYPVEAGVAPYDAAYFDRFTAQANTDIGRALMLARVAFVQRFHKGRLIDIGIGSGAFIERRNEAGSKTFGFDVNPSAKQWLFERGLELNPYQGIHSAISMWDVLEHIPDFRLLLRRVRTWVFVSIPIFKDCEHVLRSKHYRKDEHVWYFTRRGLVKVFDDCGFDMVAVNDVETSLGREDIETFAFFRR